MRVSQRFARLFPRQRRRRTGGQDPILPGAEGALGKPGRRECKDNDESARGSDSQCDNQGHRGAPCHYPAHGRAALDRSRSRYQRGAPTTARGIVPYAEASDVPDQGASLRGNCSSNAEGIVVALCRNKYEAENNFHSRQLSGYKNQEFFLAIVLPNYSFG